MPKSNHELIQEFFSCHSDEENGLIQSMIPGSLEIKISKAQKLSWDREYDTALKKAEQKKPLKSNSKGFFIPTFAALPLVMLGLVFTIIGALYILPLIAGGIFGLVMAFGIIVASNIESILNWITNAESNYNQAVDEANKLNPDYILTQKLTKLIKCGKFNMLDFPDCSEVNDENLYNNKLPNDVRKSIISQIEEINRPIIEGSWQTQPEIQIQYEGMLYTCKLAYRHNMQIELETNFHYNQGLTFFSAPPAEFPIEITKVILDKWTGLINSKLYNFASSNLLQDKLRRLDSLYNHNENHIEPVSTQVI